MLTHIESNKTPNGVFIRYKINNTPKDTSYEIAVTEYLGGYDFHLYFNDQFWIEGIEATQFPDGLAVKINDKWVGLDIICSRAIDLYEEDKESFNKSDSKP